MDQDECTSSENNALIAKEGPNKNANAKDNHKKHAKTYKFTGKCFNCGKIGQKTSDCRCPRKQSTKTNAKEAMFVTVLSAKSKSSEWYLDNGATRHMCNNAKKFFELHDTEKCKRRMSKDREFFTLDGT